jgi:hypothetical protein
MKSNTDYQINQLLVHPVLHGSAAAKCPDVVMLAMQEADSSGGCACRPPLPKDDALDKLPAATTATTCAAMCDRSQSETNGGKACLCSLMCLGAMRAWCCPSACSSSNIQQQQQQSRKYSFGSHLEVQRQQHQFWLRPGG